MYAYLEARKSTTSTALGEVRGVENYELKNTGVVGATVGLSSLGGVLFTVKGVEEEASVYGKGLKKYRLKGSWFREYEIRRRGHTIDYRRKSNGTGYGWSTTRRKNWDAFLYRELPLTVEVVLESELVRSESLTRFTAIGVEGREPTEAEVLLYEIELSADGLRWEASNVNLGVFKFSYGGLDGGVNSVGRKRLKKEDFKK